MSDPSSTVLQRIVDAERANGVAGPMTVVRAAGLAVSRAGQDVLRVPLSVIEAEHTDASVDIILDFLSKDSLLVLLHGTGGRHGFVSIDTNLLSAILQAQTMGKVIEANVPIRRPTQTDAVLTRRFLTVFLNTLASRLEDGPMASWAQNFSPRDQIPDAKRLPHILEDGLYGQLNLTIDIAQGTRSGQLKVILPNYCLAEDNAGEGSGSEQIWQDLMQERVLESTTEIEAVLMRIKLPLSQITKLAVGDTLPFSKAVLNRVRLEAAGGQLMSIARLGRSGGVRAVMLPVSENETILTPKETDVTAAERATVTVVDQG